MPLRSTLVVVRSLYSRDGSFHTAVGEPAQDKVIGYSCSVTEERKERENPKVAFFNKRPVGEEPRTPITESTFIILIY